MLVQQEILNYHLTTTGNDVRGLEFEFFCLDRQCQRLFFNKNKNNKVIELQKIFDYLIKENSFKELNFAKTIGVEKDGAKFTLEPGFQLEYSTRKSSNIKVLIKEFLDFLEICKIICEKFDLRLSDFSLFPADNVGYTSLLPVARYKIMDKYFQSTGALGGKMMRDTTSLQLTFSYKSQQDLEEKVNRLLFLKPVLLTLSSNSRIYEGKDSGYRSFREMVWKDTDPKRCGDPGKNFWVNGRWTMKDYIEKVLNAPVIFDVANKQYQAVPAQSFRSLMNNLDLASYIFHNSTIFTDIRIKDYIEMRYLDNPTIRLVPGIILLVENALNNDKIWNLLNSLPYEFENVPTVTRKLNIINVESFDLWSKRIKPILVAVIDDLKVSHPKEIHFYLDALIEKINLIGNPINSEISLQNILENSTDQFNINLAKLLA
jgi:glutamate--cysteine ligase